MARRRGSKSRRRRPRKPKPSQSSAWPEHLHAIVPPTFAEAVDAYMQRAHLRRKRGKN